MPVTPENDFVILSVEAVDDRGNWKLVDKPFVGLREEVMPEAQKLKKELIDSGFPADEVQIKESKFKEFGRTWRDET